MCVHVFHTDFVDCVGVCFPYRLIWPCNFSVSSMLRSGLLFFPWFVVAAVLLKIHRLLWSPLHFGCCGLYEVILATIGPRTTQESICPPRLWTACFVAHMQWLVFGLCWIGWFVDGPINPIVLACWFVYSWLCVSLLVPYSLEIMPSSGVVVLLRDEGADWPMVGWNVATT